MHIQENISLKTLNTFGIDVSAKLFAEVASIDELCALVAMSEFHTNERLILGGGSNILFTRDWDGLVIKNNLLGKDVVEEADDMVCVRIMSGENWHEAVMWATENGWGGIENLALIPGTVGATPVQNIGAYGVEIKETIETVGVVDLVTGEEKEFTESECNFGYRDSIFKNEAKGKYFITYIVLKLSKKPALRTDYGAITSQLAEMNVIEPGLADVCDAVIAIRQSKLPDPAVIGNAGSFFKNPIVSQSDFEKLASTYPEIPHFETTEGIKIPAGWLIEQAGWKGKRLGNVGVHDKQALVLVNHGGATGEEVKNLAYAVIDSVKEKFGIQLEPEVTIL